jgi:hypothetical protein
LETVGTFWDWLYDASKFIPAFVGSVSLLWVKDCVEKRQRKNHARGALWAIAQTELGTKDRVAGILEVGRQAVLGAPVVFRSASVDMAKHLESEAIALDHTNAPAYLRHRGAFELNTVALARFEALLPNAVASEDARDTFLIAMEGVARSYVELAASRLAVLRVLQSVETDHVRRNDVIVRAEQDQRQAADLAKEVHSFATQTAGAELKFG